MTKVALVTGGSSGIGLQTALALKNAGCRVYICSRRPFVAEGLNHLTADVTDEGQIAAAVNTVAEKEGRLDILVSNAGMGISGAVEFTTDAEARRLMDVNLFGMANAAKAALPHMRKQGGGCIVFLSSVAAPIPIPFQTWYSVSKAGVNALALALADEVRPFGISVCAVMPGDICTGFTDAREKSALGDDVYGGRIARSVAVMERDERGGMAAETAGRAIARLALKKRVNPLSSIGIKYKFFVMLQRLIPNSLCRAIVRMLYGG